MKREATGWHKSRYSQESSLCVEQGFYPDGAIAVRDTKEGDRGTILEFPSHQWDNFLVGLKKR